MAMRISWYGNMVREQHINITIETTNKSLQLMHMGHYIPNPTKKIPAPLGFRGTDMDPIKKLSHIKIWPILWMSL